MKGIHRVTTRDKEESIKTGKLYLDEMFYRYFPTIFRKPIRCNYCMSIIYNRDTSTQKHYEKKNYCSQWCLEMENPPDISHICGICEKTTHPILNKRGNSSGVYPKYCKECRSRFKIQNKMSNATVELIRESYPQFKK